MGAGDPRFRYEGRLAASTGQINGFAYLIVPTTAKQRSACMQLLQLLACVGGGYAYAARAAAL